MEGSTRSSRSTRVTPTPRRQKKVANSTPATPPPTMTMRRGQTVRSSRPVESTTPGSSAPGMGSGAGREPVATTRLPQDSRSPLSSATRSRASRTARERNTVTP